MKQRKCNIDGEGKSEVGSWAKIVDSILLLVVTTFVQDMMMISFTSSHHPSAFPSRKLTTAGEELSVWTRKRRRGRSSRRIEEQVTRIIKVNCAQEEEQVTHSTVDSNPNYYLRVQNVTAQAAEHNYRPPGILKMQGKWRYKSCQGNPLILMTRLIMYKWMRIERASVVTLLPSFHPSFHYRLIIVSGFHFLQVSDRLNLSQGCCIVTAITFFKY